MTFKSWTVLPHQPLDKHSENLWSVEGNMPGGKIRRRMTVARFGDGRLLIHSAIALEPKAMAEIEAFGEPAVLVVPNRFHRQDARTFKDRYPKAKVYCPRAAKAHVQKVVPVDGGYADAPHDDNVRLSYLEGCKGAEGLLEVRSAAGRTLIFNDGLMNQGPGSGIFRYLLAPSGRLAVVRIFRWLSVDDRTIYAAHLRSLAASPDLIRIIVSHGSPVNESVRAALERAAKDVE